MRTNNSFFSRAKWANSRGLSASVYFLSSLPLPRSASRAIFRAAFDSSSLFFAPKLRGNVCYAGYVGKQGETERG